MLAKVLRQILVPDCRDLDLTLLTTLSDQKLYEEKKKAPPTESEIYRSSQIGKLCPREEVLKWKYQVHSMEAYSPKTKRIFDIGNAFNDLIQNKWFGEWGWLIGDWDCTNCHTCYRFQKRPEKCEKCSGKKFTYIELYFEDHKFGVSGHPDGIIELPSGQKRLLELKTCNSQVYSFLINIRKRPLEAHLDQISLYQWKYDLELASVIYLNKDTSDWIEFLVRRDEWRIQNIFRKLHQIRDGMKGNTIPKREICSDKTCARARACSVRKQCFSC